VFARLKESKNIFLDNDGFLFNNTEKMNDSAIYTLREIFEIDPLKFLRKDALSNLKKFYEDNPSVFQRVPWVATQSMDLLEKRIKEQGENSLIDEFDIFRMSSRAYGGAFLYGSKMTNKLLKKKLEKFFIDNPQYKNNNLKRTDASIDLIQKNIDDYKINKEKSSISSETYITNGITSRMVFETYLGIFYGKFDQEIRPLEGAKELIEKLNIFSKKYKKRYGLISNRSEDSLIEILDRFNFIGEKMIPREFITGSDPVLGGKPRLHTFRKFIPPKEQVVYFGDLPTDVEVCEVLNDTDGTNTAFCVLIPSKFEFQLSENGDGSKNFNTKQQSFSICLEYKDILSVVNDLLKK
jgi:phosphoglycolate phosphatase-like HAD superfamily hydrolase